jgi:hypothetical protein
MLIMVDGSLRYVLLKIDYIRNKSLHILSDFYRALGNGDRNRDAVGFTLQQKLHRLRLEDSIDKYTIWDFVDCTKYAEISFLR